MIRQESLFLNDILENIKDIEDFSKNFTKKEFESDRLRQKAIIKSLEIIGEAAKNVSEKTKKKYPRTEWKNIIGTRDRITHAYFGVDYNIIWDIIKKDLPILKKQIEAIKKDFIKKDMRN